MKNSIFNWKALEYGSETARALFCELKHWFFNVQAHFLCGKFELNIKNPLITQILSYEKVLSNSIFFRNSVYISFHFRMDMDRYVQSSDLLQ